MTDDPTPSLSPELVDELCSADLDGELDAACADLGIDVDEARAAIAANASRRDVLERASALVGTHADGDGLDDFTRNRMSRDAIARGSRSTVQQRRGIVMAVGAAAVVAALAIVAFATTRDGDSSSKAASQGTAADAVIGPATTDVGTITDGRDLAHKLGIASTPGPKRSALGYSAAKTVPKAHENADAANSATTAPVRAASPTTGTGPARCLKTLPLASQATNARIVATAQLRGEPLTVARATLGDGDVLWGFRPTTCSVAVFYTGG